MKSDPALRRIAGAIYAIVATVFIGIMAILWVWSPKSEETEEVATVQVEEVQEEIVDGKDVSSGLIADEGYLTVRNRCMTCHSSKLITQNRMNRESWHETIKWMQATQNLGDLGDDEEIILNYLAKNYAPTKKGRRQNLKDVEWYVLEN